MSTLSVENVTITYTFSKTSNANSYTLTFSTITIGTPSDEYKKSRRIFLSIAGSKEVEVIADAVPSVDDLVKGVVTGTTGHMNAISDNIVATTNGTVVPAITSDVPVTISKEEKEDAKTRRTVLVRQSFEQALDIFRADYNTKKNANQLKKVYNQTSDEQAIRIKLYVFGKSDEALLLVPKLASQSGSGSSSGGETLQRIGIEEVNNGKNYLINTAAYAKYGRIEEVVDFGEVSDANQLLKIANLYLQYKEYGESSLTISAVDLHKMGDTNIKAFDLLDQVRCISAPHKLNKVFPITEMTIPLDKPDSAVYVLGKKTSNSMSSGTSDDIANVFKRINKTPSFKRVLNAAKVEMSTILNSVTTGYVNIVQENEISQALIISNEPNWQEADKIWKFNMNGLGYSGERFGDLPASEKQELINAGLGMNADDRFYKLGMTMDGTIVADFIKTGVLEDGLGYNYWNLGSGEFSLSPNTLIGEGQLLNGSVSNLEDLGSFVEASYGKEIGSKNILRKSDDFSIMNQNGKTWANGGWKSVISRQRSDKVTVINSPANDKNSVPPAPDITKAVRLHCSNATQGSATIMQESVKLSRNTIYSLACYACGTGTLSLIVTGSYTKNGVARPVTKNYSVAISHNDWRRYNFVFKTVSSRDTDTETTNAFNNMSTAYSTKDSRYTSWQNAITNNLSASVIQTRKQAYLTALSNWKSKKKTYETWKITVPLTPSGTVNVSFRSSKTIDNIYVAGLTLVKGNLSNDWSPSESDLFSEIDKFNSSLTQKKIIDKLTNGGKKEGIFLQSGHLYLNATYMYAGVISDRRGFNKWNLETGYLKTNSMVANNIRANGVLENQIIYGYYLNQQPLWDKVTLNTKGIKFTFQSYTPGRVYQGYYGQFSRGRAIGSLQIATPHLELNTTDISVVDNYSRNTKKPQASYYGANGAINIRGLIQDKNKKIKMVTLAQLTVLHGLVVGMAVYNSTTGKLSSPSSRRLKGGILAGGGKMYPYII